MSFLPGIHAGRRFIQEEHFGGKAEQAEGDQDPLKLTPPLRPATRAIQEGRSRRGSGRSGTQKFIRSSPDCQNQFRVTRTGEARVHSRTLRAKTPIQACRQVMTRFRNRGAWCVGPSSTLVVRLAFRAGSAAASFSGPARPIKGDRSVRAERDPLRNTGVSPR